VDSERAHTMTAVRAALRSVRQQLSDGFNSLNGSPRYALSRIGPLRSLISWEQALVQYCGT